MNFDSIKTPFLRILPKVFLVPVIASVLLGAFSFGAQADPQVTAILTKARSYIGKETVLNEIQTLRFRGTISTPEGDQTAIVINLRSPHKQLQILTSKEVVQEVGLNDYEAWKKVYRINQPDIYQLIPYTTDQLKRVRANTFENLNFFSPVTSYNRKLEYAGQETIDGEVVDRVKVIYGSIFYIRYFKRSNGQLLLTEIETGERIQESGEMNVGGVRFPDTLTSYIDGKEIHRIVFDSIEVNPDLDESLFTQPALPGPRKK
ncbi:MAG: hypothetical protein O7C75_15865 [Verrucomicrobia bacterium]|nr:hypothetical protein [Verrucomicrobiota bacterium]